MSFFVFEPAEALMSALQIPENLECNESSAQAGPSGETITTEI